MCEFGQVTRVALKGSARTSGGWCELDDAQVYHDHFIRANVAEGIVLDLFVPGTQDRVNVCLELDASSARQLAGALLATVEGLEAKQAEAAARLIEAALGR